MTEPSLAQRADELHAQLRAQMAELPAFSAAHVGLSLGAGVAPAGLVADLARLIEAGAS